MELARTFLERDTANWLSMLEAADVPCAPINGLDRVFAEPQAITRGLRIELAHPLGIAPSVANPIRLSETPPSYRRPPPLLGQHTDEVLIGELGLDEAYVTRLRADRVVR